MRRNDGRDDQVERWGRAAADAHRPSAPTALNQAMLARRRALVTPSAYGLRAVIVRGAGSEFSSASISGEMERRPQGVGSGARLRKDFDTIMRFALSMPDDRRGARTVHGGRREMAIAGDITIASRRVLRRTRTEIGAGIVS